MENDRHAVGCAHSSPSSTRNSQNHHFDYCIPLLCVICVFPCHRPLGLLLSTGGHRIGNVRNDLSACCAHEDGTGTDESAEVSTRKM